MLFDFFPFLLWTVCGSWRSGVSDTWFHWQEWWGNFWADEKSYVLLGLSTNLSLSKKDSKSSKPFKFQLFLHQIMKGNLLAWKSHFLLVILRWENSLSKEIANDHIFQTLHASENKKIVLINNTRKSASPPLFFSSPCKWETSLFAFEVHFFKIPTISKLDVHGWFF